MKDYGTLAKEYFYKGYNCAQSVVMAYREELGLTEEAAARLASPFGGGMGCLRETCGAFTGALMVLGMLKGYASPTDDALKAEVYAETRAFADEFVKEAGSLICHDILGPAANVKNPSKRTAEYYQSRPCPAVVAAAARLLREHLTDSIATN